MQVSAKLKNLRVSQRKTRLVADVIRGKDVETAKTQLQFSTKKTSNDILCLLNSAIANAKNNFNLDENDLFVEKIVVEEGQTLKRWMPRAQGRASAIHKRTCSVIITLGEKVEKAAKTAKGKKAEEVKEVEAPKAETDKTAEAAAEAK
jgi:large subunit ribosomal protein L22